MSEKKELLGLSLPELKDEITSLGLPAFVAGQVMDWVYRKYVTDFNLMSNISKENRKRLAEHFDIESHTHVLPLPSSDGHAVKCVFTLRDGQKVEAVVLHEKGYNTLCISSQCGCPVDCKFCLTGIVGFKRNLTAGEILNQLLYAFAHGHPISNLVFMGMGEPLLNFDEVFKAIDLITDENGFGISKRKVTVSTSGYLRNIRRLIEEKRFINLAFSVGHPDPSKRVQLMPIEQRNPIMEVSKLLHDYLGMHNRKLTLEYTLLEGKNDDEDAIRELANLSRYLNAKINLINLNPHPKIPFKPVSSRKLLEIRDTLKRMRVPVTVRFRKGQDISAACGQLGESHMEPVS